MVDKFIEDATKIIKEHNALFGIQIGRNTSQYYISPTLQEVVLNMKIHKLMMPRKSLMKEINQNI